MPLSPEFVQYLADASISEELYQSLTPVERSSILRDFRASMNPAPGNYLHPVKFIELFPSHIFHICILFALMNFIWWDWFYIFHFIFIDLLTGTDGYLADLAANIHELSSTVQQLNHVVIDMKDSMVSCFQSLNESVTNLARKIPSPSPSPTSSRTTAIIHHGDEILAPPAILQFETQNIDASIHGDMRF